MHMCMATSSSCCHSEHFYVVVSEQSNPPYHVTYIYTYCTLYMYMYVHVLMGIFLCVDDFESFPFIFEPLPFIFCAVKERRRSVVCGMW